nr:hypothetical protein [Tanacetum cinerariifolium]
MAAPTIPVSADFAQGSFEEMIDISVDIIHLNLVTAVAFPAVTIVRTLAQHMEAIRGIQEHLLGVPIQKELTALRFRVDIAEAENALLRARIKTIEAVEKITRNHKMLARIRIEQQLVPSCFAIFDLEPLSLSFDFIFTSKIFKSLSFSLDRLCHLAILCLDHHTHTLHHLESLLTISLDRLNTLKEDLSIGSSSYMGLISASSSCASFPDLLLISYSFESVPLLSVSTKLASIALLVSTFSFGVCICLLFTQLSCSLLCCALSSIKFLTHSICYISVSWNSRININQAEPHAKDAQVADDEFINIFSTPVMAAPTILVTANSFEKNFKDTIDISVDVIQLVPIALVVFPAVTIVITLAQHGEAIRGIDEHLLGVPIQEELTALRNRVDIVKAEDASLHATISITPCVF